MSKYRTLEEVVGWYLNGYSDDIAALFSPVQVRVKKGNNRSSSNEEGTPGLLPNFTKNQSRFDIDGRRGGHVLLGCCPKAAKGQ